MAAGGYRGSLFFFLCLVDAEIAPGVGGKNLAPSLAQETGQLFRVGDGWLTPEPTTDHR
jgi:hypothetical protein